MATKNDRDVKCQSSTGSSAVLVGVDLVVCSWRQRLIESTLCHSTHRLLRLGDSTTACPTEELLPTEVRRQTQPRVPVM